MLIKRPPIHVAQCSSSISVKRDIFPIYTKRAQGGARKNTPSTLKTSLKMSRYNLSSALHFHIKIVAYIPKKIVIA